MGWLALGIGNQYRAKSGQQPQPGIEYYKEKDGNIVATLYSSYTMEQLKDIQSIEVDKIKVKGKEELITIYKPVMKEGGA